MATGFFDFLRKTNALALAVAVIIGAAIGKVVSSVVADLLMPVIGLFVGGGEWRTPQIRLRTAPDGKVLSALAVGNFPGSPLKETPAPPGPAMKPCGACGESILAKATRGRYCTSAA